MDFTAMINQIISSLWYLIPIAILGIMGTNDAIDFQNRMARAERENNND